MAGCVMHNNGVLVDMSTHADCEAERGCKHNDNVGFATRGRRACGGAELPTEVQLVFSALCSMLISCVGM